MTKEPLLSALALVLGALIVLTLVLAMAFPRSADCAWCVATFCGFDSECPPGCSCAIPWGEVTGHCSG